MSKPNIQLIFETHSNNKYTNKSKSTLRIFAEFGRMLVILLPALLHRRKVIQVNSNRYFSSNILFDQKEYFLARFFSDKIVLNKGYDIIAVDVENQFRNMSFITVESGRVYWYRLISLSDITLFFVSLFKEILKVLNVGSDQRVLLSRLISIDTIRSYICYILVKELNLRQDRLTVYRISENQSLDKAHALALTDGPSSLIYIYASIINLDLNSHLLLQNDWVKRSLFGIIFYSNSMRLGFHLRCKPDVPTRFFLNSFFANIGLSISSRPCLFGVLLTALPSENEELLKICKNLSFTCNVRHHPRLTRGKQGSLYDFLVNQYVVLSTVSSSILDALLSGTFVIIYGECPSLPEGYEGELWWRLATVKDLDKFIVSRDWENYQIEQRYMFEKFRACF